MGLTAEQIERREGKLTASRVACLMTSDETKIMNLWREMVCDPTFEPEDLSDVLPVQLGSFTEPFNLDWFERTRGPAVRRGEVVEHPNGWAACTLDGWSALHNCPIECKHCGGHEPFEVIRERYQPQMHWQMIVTGAQRCALSVLMSNRAHVVEVVDRDADYAAELMRRAEVFMGHVRALTLPVNIPPPVEPPVPGKTYEMTGNNEWADHAATWLENIVGRKKADAAEKSLKAMVPADAIKCAGHGVQITRNRANSLALREESK